ncbi:MAG: DNA polymerase Y family protein [Myxococcota bacterium]|nr:DNA polymerase Y family protein [Myxococcota bacterium]
MFLPNLRIELVRSEMSDPRAPLALVIARGGGAVKDERSLLGNTRLDEVSSEARALGVRSRQTIAAARARCSSLRVRVVALGAVRDALARIAESLLAVGATTSFDLEGNVVWVDVTGCGHLHRSSLDPSGEPTLAKRIRDHVAALDHVCKVAIADGPVVAAAVARYETRETTRVVAPGSNAEALAPLPLCSLPLSDDAIHWLKRLGLQTVGDLARMPRSSLAVRLGAVAPQVMGLLVGQDATPLTPHVPPAVPEEAVTLEYGIESTEALLFVMKRLCDGLARRIAGRALAISQLEVVFDLDRGMTPSVPRVVLNLALSAPLTEAAEILGVVRARIDSYTIEAPILSVRLRGVETVPLRRSQLHIFIPESKAERVIPRLAAELEATLGPGTVGTLQLTNRWLPAERSQLVPLSGSRALPNLGLSVPDSHAGALLSGALEPTRWLSNPVPCPSVVEVRVVARLEAGEWWERGLVQGDYGTTWIESVPAVAWVELDHVRSAVFIRGWVD